jgi:hypothetical protein
MFDHSTYGFNSFAGYKVVTDGSSSYVSGLCNKTYKVVSGIFDLKFDLTNMLYGYHSDRRWNTALYAGPILSKHASMSADVDGVENIPAGGKVSLNPKAPEGTFWGLHTSLNAGYRVNDNLGLFGEVGVKVYKNEFMSEALLDYNPVRAVTWQLGVKYNLK